MRFREWACPSYSHLRDVTSGSVVQRPFFVLFCFFAAPGPLAGGWHDLARGGGGGGDGGPVLVAHADGLRHAHLKYQGQVGGTHTAHQR